MLLLQVLYLRRFVPDELLVRRSGSLTPSKFEFISRQFKSTLRIVSMPNLMIFGWFFIAGLQIKRNYLKVSSNTNRYDLRIRLGRRSAGFGLWCWARIASRTAFPFKLYSSKYFNIYIIYWIKNKYLNFAI